ncbi:MAG TPA: MGMT family protein [Candidatus Nanoarchaeia archaeon]|nr:MGMT family protein [Candidatus Nanoarchaeia archaeon]
MNLSFNEKVWALTAKIPKGKVTTYKIIAEKLGTKAYRAVGAALAKNPYAPKVPCHRVVCSDGRVGGYNGSMDNKEKTRLLKKEGVKINNGKISHFKAGEIISQ